MKYYATLEETVYIVEVHKDGRVSLNGEPYNIEQQPIGGYVSSLLIGNRSVEAVVVPNGNDSYEVNLSGEQYHVLVQDELTHRVAQAQEAAAANIGEVTVKSPMPGLIVNVPVAEGDTVTKGQTVIILESMKMENELKSPRDGIVLSVGTANGASVEKGQQLITIGDGE